jgi:hypothetical protein
MLVVNPAPTSGPHPICSSTDQRPASDLFKYKAIIPQPRLF